MSLSSFVYHAKYTCSRYIVIGMDPSEKGVWALADTWFWTRKLLFSLMKLFIPLYQQLLIVVWYILATINCC